MRPSRVLTGGLGLILLAGCTAVPGSPAAVSEPEPPAPPAACLLDTAALAADSGVAWEPDLITATDTRCVYDAGEAFLAVDIAPGTDDLETPAQLCDATTRTDLPAGGLVCRFGDGVFAAAVLQPGEVADGDALLTIAAAQVPAGSDAPRLADALARQLEVLTGR